MMFMSKPWGPGPELKSISSNPTSDPQFALAGAVGATRDVKVPEERGFQGVMMHGLERP